MEIKKHKESFIKRNYFFVQGNISNIDAKYLCEAIDKGVQEKNNKTNQTNVIGHMTDWKYFINDNQFLKCVMPLMDYVEKNQLLSNNWGLLEAWGVKETFGMYTNKHDHDPAIWSGVIYLSKSSQSLIFPQINEEVDAEIGNFVIFSSFLEHETKHRISNLDQKYGIAFNFTRKAV